MASHQWAVSAVTVVATAVISAGPVTAFDQDAALAPQVDALFRRQIGTDTPGCAVGVYRRGQIVLARGYGVASIEDGRPITPRSVFNLGSASKPFTTLAVLLLERRGRLSMEDDVRKWVPELPDYGRPIRVRDLLHHTSGLRDFETLQVLSGRPVVTMRDFLGLMAGQRALNFEPASTHEYSHSDFGVLGLVVERVAGEPFGEHMRREVFVPLGMNDTFVDDGGAGQRRERVAGHRQTARGLVASFPSALTFGGDNVYTSIEDLARWDRQFASPIEGTAGLMARMVSRPTLANGDTIPYAYGLRVGSYRGLRTVLRGGHPPGIHAWFMRYPDQDFAVATLCNSDTLESGRLSEAVADLYLGAAMASPPVRPAAPAAVTMTPQQFQRYAGVYRSVDDPWDLLPIEVRSGVLGEVVFDDDADEAFYPMTPAGGGRFFEIGTTGNVGIFTFTTTSSGAPLRLEIAWSGGTPTVLERLPDAAVWRPSAAELREYTGAWFNPDLDATWQLEVRGDRLVWRRRGQPDMTLLPVARDRFVRGLGVDNAVSVRLHFHRDSSGRLFELVVSTPPASDSVQNLRFIRMPTAGSSSRSASTSRADHRASRTFIRSQQARKACLLHDQPFGEAPWASASLVLEVDPMGPRTGMPESVPEHREIVAIRRKPHNVFDTDPLRVSASKPVRDAQRSAFACAPAAQKALIPAAWRQLVPNEGGDAA